MRLCQPTVKLSLILLMTAFFLAGPPAGLAEADDYSRHCRQDGGEVMLVEGTYNGTWEEALSITQSVEGMTINQVFTASGEFRLTIDKTPDGQAPGRDGSSIQGEMKTHTRMSAPMAGQRLAGRGALALDGAVGADSFSAKVNHTTAGNLYSAGGYNQKQSFSDVVTIRFQVDQADCNGASGKVRSDALTGIARMSEAAGYTLEWLPSKWQMQRVEGASDAIARLKEELNRPPAPGIVRTRDVEGRRLGQIADRIRQEPDDLQDCLFSIWLSHVEQQFQSWAAEDTASLNSFNGNYYVLTSLCGRALEADRALCLVGRDACSEAIHQELWAALQGAVSRYLKRMADGDAPMGHLLEVMRQGQLLGAISPQLNEQCWAAVREQAKQQADVTWENYRTAYGAAPGGPGDKARNQAVTAALGRALEAETAANYCDLELDRAASEALRLQADAQGG